MAKTKQQLDKLLIQDVANSTNKYIKERKMHMLVTLADILTDKWVELKEFPYVHSQYGSYDIRKVNKTQAYGVDSDGQTHTFNLSELEIEELVEVLTSTSMSL